MSNDPKEPLLLDHNYDGIQELDNNLPRWWVWLFYITIIFSAVYLVYYHVAAAGDLQAAEYDQGNEGRRAIKGAAMGKFEAGIPTLHAVHRCGRAGKRPPDLRQILRALPSRGRRRPRRPEPHGRLLDSRQQLCGHRESHLGRRAGQGHDHLESGFEAGPDPGRGQLHLHAARRETRHARQAAGKSNPGQATGPSQFE